MSSSRPPGPSNAEPPARASARTRLIEAAHGVVRRQGYAATSVDEICRAAGVSKGAFFHHFASKEALAVAAAEAWTERARPLFAVPAIVTLADPAERVLAHIDLRLSLLDGPAEDFTCFVGTMVQESFASSPAIRTACGESIDAYCAALGQEIDAALPAPTRGDGVTALSLARHAQAVLQGAFVMAKASGDAATAREAVMHLKTYLRMILSAGGGPRPHEGEEK